MDTQQQYRAFAQYEAAGSSPVYEALALAVADSVTLLSHLDGLPRPKRQPNLLLAAARLAGAPLEDGARFVTFVLSHWGEVSRIMRTRSTQTNEAARTATFLPLLAAIEGPVALVEVGCSAGLCLYPDRYAISYDRRPSLVRRSPVAINVATSGGVPRPEHLPEIVARIGVDLNPLDITLADDRAWLEALIWPEHHERLRRLRAAAAVVADDPPRMVTGDLVDSIDEALAHVPPEATPVVFHSAVLAYVDRSRRAQFAARLRHHPGVVWIANEAPGVMVNVTTELQPPPTANARAFFVLSLGTTTPVAISDPHGSWIRWLN